MSEGRIERTNHFSGLEKKSLRHGGEMEKIFFKTISSPQARPCDLVVSPAPGRRISISATQTFDLTAEKKEKLFVC